MGGLVIPAPRNTRHESQQQSIRDAEIPPDDYYPKGYKPDLMQDWPTDKPVFIPADKVPPGLWLHPKRDVGATVQQPANAAHWPDCHQAT